jgi:Ca2+-binding RTX toxin-like protein
MLWPTGAGSDLIAGAGRNDAVEVYVTASAGDVFTIVPNGPRFDFDRVNFGQFSLDIGTTETLEVNGLGGNDTITGASGLDGLIKLVLSGGLGNDSITGGDGDDVMVGDAGNDR